MQKSKFFLRYAMKASKAGAKSNTNRRINQQAKHKLNDPWVSGIKVQMKSTHYYMQIIYTDNQEGVNSHFLAKYNA